MLPPAAVDHEFRVYRAGDLMLVRNTGTAPLWIRGRSVATGSFLRMRERQPLVVPGWTLSYEDLMFFLDVKRTGNAPAIYLEAGETGLTAERTPRPPKRAAGPLRTGGGSRGLAATPISTPAAAARSRRATWSSAAITSGSAMSPASACRSTNSGAKPPNPAGASAWPATARSIWSPTTPSALARGDLLLGPKLSPKTVLFIRYDAQRAEGELQIRESNGPILVDGVAGAPHRHLEGWLADPPVRQPVGALPLQRGLSR